MKKYGVYILTLVLLLQGCAAKINLPAPRTEPQRDFSRFKTAEMREFYRVVPLRTKWLIQEVLMEYASDDLSSQLSHPLFKKILGTHEERRYEQIFWNSELVLSLHGCAQEEKENSNSKQICVNLAGIPEDIPNELLAGEILRKSLRAYGQAMGLGTLDLVFLEDLAFKVFEYPISENNPCHVKQEKVEINRFISDYLRHFERRIGELKFAASAIEQPDACNAAGKLRELESMKQIYSKYLKCSSPLFSTKFWFNRLRFEQVSWGFGKHCKNTANPKPSTESILSAQAELQELVAMVKKDVDSLMERSRFVE